MNTALRTTLTLALGISASSSAILAQTSAAPLKLAALTPPATTVSTYDPAVVRARLDKASDLLLEGQISAARKEYVQVIELQRSYHVLPAEAMWQLAGLYNSERSWKRTATILNELADDAERYGNPQVRAQALLEATILYNKARMPQEALTCAKRLDDLMASPYVTDELRQEVQRRIVR